VSRRRRTGRVRIAFEVLEKLAAQYMREDALAQAMGSEGWTLTRHSALHRCKNGTYTLCLIWHSGTGLTFTSTTRGLRLEVA